MISKKILNSFHGSHPFAVGEDLMLLSGGRVNYWHSVIASELDRVEEGTRVRGEKAE